MFGHASQFESRQGTARLADKSGPKETGIVEVEWQVPVEVRRYLLVVAD